MDVNLLEIGGAESCRRREQWRKKTSRLVVTVVSQGCGDSRQRRIRVQSVFRCDCSCIDVWITSLGKLEAKGGKLLQAFQSFTMTNGEVQT